MKKILSFGVLCSLLSLPAVSKADFLYDFNSSVSTGGAANFGPQDGWTINDPTEDVSFLVPVAGFGQSVALGGYLSAPSVGAVNLTQSASETLAGGTFSVDFALVNSDDADPGSFFEEDDSFSINLGGTEGFAYALTLIPTGAEDIRDILSTNSTDTGAISTGDYSLPAFYTLSISFTANGADLDYVAQVMGGSTGTFPVPSPVLRLPS
jgi:Fe-S cluster assembly iron-binding protein IscA